MIEQCLNLFKTSGLALHLLIWAYIRGYDDRHEIFHGDNNTAIGKIMGICSLICEICARGSGKKKT